LFFLRIGDNKSVITERRIPLLDLQAQHGAIREEVLSAVTAVIDSQRFILGEQGRGLEQEIAAYTGTRFAVGCASGTDALFLALVAGGIQPGDAVLTTPFTFFATAGAIHRAGAVPVFADIDEQTFNLDVDRAAEALASRPGIRAVIPVHLYGGSADMDPLLEVAQKYDLLVIEDAAQAIGSEYKNRRIGGLGHVGCFSFFPSKNLGGAGDGGMLTTNDPKLRDRLSTLRVHGSARKYYHDEVGFNSRLDELQSAVLRVKLRHLDAWTRARQANAERYTRLFAELDIPAIVPHIAPYQTRHVFNQFVIRCPERDQLREYLAGQGIGAEIYYPLPLHLQACFVHLGYKRTSFPVSERVAEDCLALPIYSELTSDDVEYVCQTIQSFYKLRKRGG
jgi:dTDP-4-amino-4,6-dideoxygalactose transaminase